MLNNLSKRAAVIKLPTTYYLLPTTYYLLSDKYDHIIAMIIKMMSNPDQWIIKK